MANRITIRTGLSLAIAAILIAAIGVFGTLAYFRVKQATLDAAFVRLRSAAQQFALISVRGLQDRATAVRQTATDPAVREALRTRVATPAAMAALARLGPDTGSTRAVELRDATGATILSLGRQAPPRMAGLPDSAGVSPLFRFGDTAAFEVTAPVVAPNGQRGYLAQVRTVVATQGSNRRLADLVGPGGLLLVGNLDGSVWTDLEQFIDRPPPSFAGTHYSRAGRERLAASAPVTGTPLVFGVELPRDEALAAAEGILMGFVGIGGLVVVVGILLAWAFGVAISRPVVELTAAAERITEGDLGYRPKVNDRDDEIGRLARSFTVMAESVRRGRDTLEQQVNDRTADLGAALAKLEATQDELVRKERLAALGLLSGGVGHELRNPLGVMSNALYFLELSQPDAPPKVREYHGIIRSQIRAAEKIVSDLLDFARARTPERSPVVLAPFVDEQIGRVTIPASIEVLRDLPGDLPTPNVDPDQVGQVMVNLLTNAVQAMEDTGGILTVRARANNGSVHLEVRDTGPGVVDGNVERVFEPLYTTKARGIGLGLSISRILARSNGGDLTVASPPGEGAVFTLELPVKAAS